MMQKSRTELGQVLHGQVLQSVLVKEEVVHELDHDGLLLSRSHGREIGQELVGEHLGYQINDLLKRHDFYVRSDHHVPGPRLPGVLVPLLLLEHVQRPKIAVLGLDSLADKGRLPAELHQLVPSPLQLLVQLRRVLLLPDPGAISVAQLQGQVLHPRVCLVKHLVVVPHLPLQRRRQLVVLIQEPLLVDLQGFDVLLPRLGLLPLRVVVHDGLVQPLLQGRHLLHELLLALHELLFHDHAVRRRGGHGLVLVLLLQQLDLLLLLLLHLLPALHLKGPSHLQHGRSRLGLLRLLLRHNLHVGRLLLDHLLEVVDDLVRGEGVGR
mmetsp:Transcript_3534/g.9946  ORF Transcript_3534/g.9946 Transcript_3534/m.9946 type:complete len:323 (+) Transcript_3534:4490-5458(+)